MALAETHTRLRVMVPPPETPANADDDELAITSAVDIDLSKNMTFAELTANIVAYLRTVAFAEDHDPAGRYEGMRARLADPYAVWQLASPTGVHYSVDEDIVSAGLTDGDTIALVDSEQRDNFRPTIDDTAESVAQTQRLTFAAWASKNSRAVGAVALPLAFAVLGIVLVTNVSTEAIGAVGQYVGAAIFAFAAAVLLVGSAMGRDSDAEPDMERLLAGTVFSGYVSLAVAGLLIVPGGFSGWSLLLAAALVACAALVMNQVIRFPESINYACLWLGVLVAIGSVAASVSGMSTTAIAVTLGVLSIVLVAVSQKFALKQSGIPMTYVPAQGETFISDDGADLASFESTTRNDVVAAILGHKEKVITGRQALTGMTWAALAVSIVAAAVSGAVSAQDHPLVVLCFWAAMVIALLFRAKAGMAAIDQGSIIVGAFLIAVAYLLGAAFSPTSYVLVLSGALILVLGTGLGVWTSAQVPTDRSPNATKILEFIEYVTWASVPVLWGFVIDLFAMGRAAL